MPCSALRLEVVELARGGGQRFAKLRVGDGDQCAGALGERASVEFGDTIFGDDVVNVVAAGDDACAEVERGNDARDGVVARG